MGLGAKVPSLHPGSTAEYHTGQIRQCARGKVRVQGANHYTGSWEETQSVSKVLGQYIAARMHTGASIAATATMYVPCQLRQEGAGYARIQIPGPSVNRPWGVEFVIPLIHSHSLPPNPNPTKAPKFPMQVFAVGDAVKVIKEGDGCPTPCTGGPKVGTLTTIRKISTDGDDFGPCGTIVIKVATDDDDTWITTPEHLALVVQPPSPPIYAPDSATQHVFLSPPSPAPPSFLAAALHSKTCDNCGQPSGKHYLGGSKSTFSPALCPQPKAVCDVCGPVGPKPMAIHLIGSTCGGKDATPELTPLQTAYLVKFGTFDPGTLADNGYSVPCSQCGDPWIKHSNATCPKLPLQPGPDNEVPF